MLRPGMYLQERYEIIEKIGSGGMADVFKAQCHTLNRLVAVKVLKEEFCRKAGFVEHFKMEAQAAACLAHPNIVNVYDVIDEGDLHYIIMELIEGITLKSYIANKGCLEVKETIGIAIQVAQGMSAAHQQGIVHRDIKPQNIIISKDGKVKVADFGIARILAFAGQDTSAVGSVHYISPEQARGEAVDARSDIYSLGITMFEMVTGRLPFDGENLFTVAMAHQKDPIASPKEENPDIPECLEEIILTCTEKRPEDRYHTAEEVITDLRRARINPQDVIFESFGRKAWQKERPDHEAGGEGQSREDGAGSTGESGLGQVFAQERMEQPVEEPVRGTKKRVAEGKGRGGQGAQRPRIGRSDDITHQLERIFAVSGVVAAVMIAAVLLIVAIRLGDLFHLGSPVKDTDEPTKGTVGQVTTAALAEGQAAMPNLLTKPLPMTEEEARETLEGSGLKMAVSSVENSNEIPEGYVMAQEYPEGTILEKGTVVNVKVSKGSGNINLDGLDLAGVEQQEAIRRLQERGLVVSVTEDYSDTVPAGSVIGYEPAEPREGETVTLLVSKGLAPGPVPDVTGLLPEAADAALLAAGFLPEMAGEEYSDEVEEGLAFGQTAPAGLPYQRGLPIQYYVSLGPEETMIGTTRYVASIDKQYNLSLDFGPGSSQTSVRVVIRLRQEVNGRAVFKDLVEPREVVGDTVIPVSFSRIEGADGVDEGFVEVVDLDANKILVSYPVSFFKTESP